MMRFGFALDEPHPPPEEGLKKLAAAIGKYVALEEIREEKAARAEEQKATKGTAEDRSTE